MSRVDAEQRLRFRPSGPVDDGLLTGLPGVRTVTRDGSTIVVSGTGNLVQSVMAALARHQIVANDLRIDQADLDDAFVALTGRQARQARPRRSQMLTRITAVEARLFFREPGVWLLTILLPTIVLVVVGSLFGTEADPALGGRRWIDIFAPSMVVMTLAILGVNTLPARLVKYREKGVLRRLSTTPRTRGRC